MTTRSSAPSTAAKKTHTLKALLVSDRRRWIGYVSPCSEDRTHDFALLKSVFPPDQDWFKPFTVCLALGFLGFAKAYVARQVKLPHKKPRSAELTAQQRKQNRRQARKRVRIEHSVVGSSATAFSRSGSACMTFNATMTCSKSVPDYGVFA